MSVAKRFLADIADMDESTKDNLAQHMAFAHMSVAKESKR